ncbi:hypothetical protein ABKN59_004725 [Abortiporus biennis]
MTSPIQWLDSAFPSRGQAEQLLKPDLESGLITQHDFNMAVTFFPGPQRYMPTVFGTIFSGSLLAGIFGTFYGNFRRAKMHYRFVTSLTNPEGFNQALENVNRRLGNVEPLGWSLPGIRDAENEKGPEGVGKEGAARDIDGSPSGAVERWDENGSQALPPTPVIVGQTQQTSQQVAPQSRPTSAKPASKWDEIRASNNGAKTSSWDALRQGHERNTLPEGVSIQSPTLNTDDERAREQARFDALLEAERRLSRGSS